MPDWPKALQGTVKLAISIAWIWTRPSRSEARPRVNVALSKMALLGAALRPCNAHAIVTRDADDQRRLSSLCPRSDGGPQQAGHRPCLRIGIKGARGPGSQHDGQYGPTLLRVPGGIEFAASLKYDLGVGRNGSDIVILANDIF